MKSSIFIERWGVERESTVPLPPPQLLHRSWLHLRTSLCAYVLFYLPKHGTGLWYYIDYCFCVTTQVTAPPQSLLSHLSLSYHILLFLCWTLVTNAISAVVHVRERRWLHSVCISTLSLCGMPYLRKSVLNILRHRDRSLL
jgi:hypothetical protein